MKKLFVPEDFQVPKALESEHFRLRTLTVHDVVKDYDAVMTSVDHLQGVFGSHRDWPQGLTFEQDLIDRLAPKGISKTLIFYLYGNELG